MNNIYSDKTKRHILSLSGGKDSTALAIFLKGKIANVEYVFCDTKKELPETYEYLDKLEVFLEKKIERLVFEGGDFDDLLEYRNGFLPSAQVRWCTEQLKIKPFEKHIGDDYCYSYIGIRADEKNRTGYISTKKNIIPVYPFIENGITKPDVIKLLEESGLGIPEYYTWRSRSGCYFCFFQQKMEWVGLKENHPDLFKEAKKYEKLNSSTGERYTWSMNESLNELEKPERIKLIKKDYEERKKLLEEKRTNLFLKDILAQDNEDDDEGCLICHL